jgi:salicylate hydroxylase
MSLNVTIVGAGLAGLAAGRVLREKHNVTFLERFSGGHELGAAINLGPSAVRIMKRLGFDPEKACSQSAGLGRTFIQTGKQIGSMDMLPFCKMAEADWYFQHRGDLWNEFCRLATAPSAELGIAGQPAKILWGVDVVHVDVNSGDVKLADGNVIPSDLVIGAVIRPRDCMTSMLTGVLAADGIKSVVRPLIVGEEAFRTARPSGTSAFRFTIPAEIARVAMNDPTMDRLLDPTQICVLDVHINPDGSNRSVVMYACRNFELVNFVCIAPDSCIKAQTTESWSATGTNEDLLDAFDDFSYVRPLLE